MVTTSILRAAFNHINGNAATDADHVHPPSLIFSDVLNNFDDLFSISDLSICDDEDVGVVYCLLHKGIDLF
jgi:hypothetical protein